MKKLTPFDLAVLFAGCFLGAGYVSGQELWQYFGAFGAMGWIGMFISILLLFGSGYLIIIMAMKTGESEPDKLTVMWDIPVLRGAVVFLQVLFMFAIISIMTAGIGELFHDLLNINAVWGRLGFTVVVAVFATVGLNGILAAFSVSVPILVLCTLAFGIYAAVTGTPEISAAEETNSLLGGWLASSVNYACTNIFPTIAIIAPFGARIKNRSVALKGLSFGSVILIVIASSVMICISVFAGAESHELPMLFAAGEIGVFPMYLHGILMFAGMFGTTLSNLVALDEYFGKKSERLKKHRIMVIAVIALLSFAASFFGFGDLIGLIYPIFGYAGGIFMALMLIHYIKLILNDRRRDSKG